MKQATELPSKSRFVRAILPVGLLAGLTVFLLALGPAGLFGNEFPPVEDLSFGRITLSPGRIETVVTNGGPDPVTIAQVLVDEAYWQHSVTPERELDRLESATITIPYPWVEGEPADITVVSSTGVTFSHTIDVAVATPPTSGRFLLTFGLLGIYIGVIPVLFGMAWLPFLRTVSRKWVAFFMALTGGVLVFLLAETLAEAREGAESVPSALGGVGLITAAAVGAFSLILVLSRTLQRSRPGDRRLVVAYAVAAGIGLHNLGEGLAVGSAYRLGEIALGTALVVGFALHNTTEGLGIVSIISDRGAALRTLLLLGLIAGAPTILGAWVGAFVFTPLVAVGFLAVAAGAIAEVAYEVLKTASEESPSGLFSPHSLAGIAAGVMIMYLTGIFVPA